MIVGYWIEILINEVITRLPSPDFAIRSRTLDKKARFVIGRKLLNSSGSNERFLIEGTIRPSLKTVSKTPEVDDEFIISVIMGSTLSWV